MKWGNGGWVNEDQERATVRCLLPFYLKNALPLGRRRGLMWLNEKDEGEQREE